MHIQSPISNLREVLALVKETAVTYQTQFLNNEAATRLALVDPVLTALGWNMANPLMVVVENTAQFSRADYVLYDSGRSPKIIVEAKALGIDVSSGTSQLFATAGRIQKDQTKTGFITNGLVWEHYHHSSALTQHAFIVSYNIVSSDLQKFAAHLIQHLDAAQFWPQEEDTTAPEILRLQQDYAVLEKKVNALGGGNTHPPSPPIIQSPNWVNIDSLPTDMTRTVPSKLRLSDGTEKDVRSWRQALLVACEMALMSNPTILLPLSDKAGGSIKLINTVQAPRCTSLTLPSGVTVFIYSNYSANGCIANIKHVLSQISTKGQAANSAFIFTHS